MSELMVTSHGCLFLIDTNDWDDFGDAEKCAHLIEDVVLDWDEKTAKDNHHLLALVNDDRIDWDDKGLAVLHEQVEACANVILGEYNTQPQSGHNYFVHAIGGDL